MTEKALTDREVLNVATLQEAYESVNKYTFCKIVLTVHEFL